MTSLVHGLFPILSLFGFFLFGQGALWENHASGPSRLSKCLLLVHCLRRYFHMQGLANRSWCSASHRAVSKTMEVALKQDRATTSAESGSLDVGYLGRQA
jgi:hypothetical protein